MKKINPSIPKGTRDFGPEEMIKREYIFFNLKKVFSKYGFQNIETPSMENMEVLKGKYGEEGDKLLYSILNSGDFLKNKKISSNTNYNKLKSNISKKGLRYDLTVPLARYVSMNRNNINFPFKRYQLQQVWRADKPQRGRYREFYQCDIDYIGTKSLFCEIEIIKIINEVLSELRFNDFIIKLNNRKILIGIADLLNIRENFSDFCMLIDKIDKVGIEGIKNDLIKRNFNNKMINALKEILNFSGNNEEKLDFLKKKINKSKIGIEGIEELREIITISDNKNMNTIIDFSLARGLSYYTSSIFEVIPKKNSIGSLAGGGRYDNLTEVFGLKDMSGIGISFGIERIYNIMEENNLFPKEIEEPCKVLVTNLNKEVVNFSMEIANKLRKNNISTEMYLSYSKLKKQLQFANNKKIPYVVIIGEDEKKVNKITLKNMNSGNQQLLEVKELLNILS